MAKILVFMLDHLGILFSLFGAIFTIVVIVVSVGIFRYRQENKDKLVDLGTASGGLSSDFLGSSMAGRLYQKNKTRSYTWTSENPWLGLAFSLFTTAIGITVLYFIIPWLIKQWSYYRVHADNALLSASIAVVIAVTFVLVSLKNIVVTIRRMGTRYK